MLTEISIVKKQNFLLNLFQYDAKAIGSGSEGAQQSLQVQTIILYLL